MIARETEFDFVIVGGGTAGCVLANRLSANGHRVVLLEAGHWDRNPLIHVPAGFAKLNMASYSWGFVSAPQRHCDDREVAMIQGKVMGGGGSINAQVCTRGAHSDYDRWESEHGCEGWGFKDILKYFLRSEDNQRLSLPWHGVGGPLGVSDVVNPHPLTHAFVRAGQEFGLPFNTDFNGASQYGVGPYQTTTRRGRRCSAAVGYLRPVRSRPNLAVKANILATRIVLDGRRAVGVEVIDGGDLQRFDATREVIVTAGALNSPKLLMLSGIGDPDHLKAVGVPLKVALRRVGRNLQDHWNHELIYELRDRQSLDMYNKVRPATVGAVIQYGLYRKGPLASSIVEAGAFTHADGGEDTPDLQFGFLPAARNKTNVEPLTPGYGCALVSWCLRPRSTGTVRLRSADPARPPVVDPNYLDDDYDVEMSVEGLLQSREIMSQPSLSRLIRREHYPGAAVSTREDCIRQIRTQGRTAYHHVGTCAMGTGDDAVVDPQLRVRGVNGLRVCDSSVMPRIVSSNTQATTVMIAEKASDMILAAG